MHQPKHHPNTSTQIVQHLQRSSGSRAVLYLVLEAITLETMWRLHDKTKPYAPGRINLATLPFATTVTYLFLRYLPQEQLEQGYTPTSQNMCRLLQGMGLGTAAFLTYMAMLKAKGWGSLSGWGWEETSPTAVGESLVVNGLGIWRLPGMKSWSFVGMGLMRYAKPGVPPRQPHL